MPSERRLDSRVHLLWSIWACVAAMVAIVEPLAAQTVYRCGPAGRSYSHQPCVEGRPVDVQDARTPSQRSEAEAAVVREGRMAGVLERKRLDAEAAGRAKPAMAFTGDRRPQAVSEVGAKSAQTGAAKKVRRVTPKTADFRATSPQPAKKKAAKAV